MKTSLTLMSLGLWLVMQGCGASNDTQTDPKSVEADEIDQIISALETDPAGAVDDVAADDSLADDADGGAVDGPGDGPRGHHGRGHGPRRGDRRGRGVGLRDLILWYGDLTALQACRDDRDTCLASGVTTCDDAARDCVRAVIEGAFDAMCEDRTASCEDAGVSDGACGRIIARCEAGLPVWGDGGFSGGGGHHHGRGYHGGGRNCDGGDDEEPPPPDLPGPDASTPAP